MRLWLLPQQVCWQAVMAAAIAEAAMLPLLLFPVQRRLLTSFSLMMKPAKNVLKTADHVNTNDIPEDQFPEGYHVAKPKDLEIRIKDDKKYIYVFVTDVTYTDISKKVEITLRDMSNYGAVIKTTATINKDATTVMPKEIELPEGYEFYPESNYKMDEGYSLNMEFMVQKISG